MSLRNLQNLFDPSISGEDLYAEAQEGKSRTYTQGEFMAVLGYIDDLACNPLDTSSESSESESSCPGSPSTSSQTPRQSCLSFSSRPSSRNRFSQSPSSSGSSRSESSGMFSARGQGTMSIGGTSISSGNISIGGSHSQIATSSHDYTDSSDQDSNHSDSDSDSDPSDASSYSSDKLSRSVPGSPAWNASNDTDADDEADPTPPWQLRYPIDWETVQNELTKYNETADEGREDTIAPPLVIDQLLAFATNQTAASKESTMLPEDRAVWARRLLCKTDRTSFYKKLWQHDRQIAENADTTDSERS